VQIKQRLFIKQSYFRVVQIKQRLFIKQSYFLMIKVLHSKSCFFTIVSPTRAG